MRRWDLTNVLVAGRRVSGEASGRDAAEAVRHLAAAEARSRKVDVAAAIAGALADRYKKVTELKPEDTRHDADAILAEPPAPDWTEWPAMSRARKVVEGSARETLEREFSGRDDDFWDVEWTPDGVSVGDRESGSSSFRKSGYSGVQCTGFACEILARLGPTRVQVYGFRAEDNPSSQVAQMAGGHDFAVVDGRYIVDPWISEIESLSERSVFDLQDPGDSAEITRLYGERQAWKPAKSTGSRVRFAR